MHLLVEVAAAVTGIAAALGVARLILHGILALTFGRRP